MTAAVVQRVSLLAGDIKLAHSVFALPFAVLATFLAAEGFSNWIALALIIVCMVFARTFAMVANGYLDRRIDAANPRTAGRALPSGRLKARDAIAAMVVSAVALVGGAAGFGLLEGNWWPLVFSPVVLLWLWAYGLTKRHTLLCHFFLGAALGMSPLAAGLAIEPAYLGQPTLWLLAGFVLLWVGGFDIIYALQDIDVDRREGLRSVPAALGRDGALVVSRAAHVLAVGLLVTILYFDRQLGLWFLVGVAAVGAVLLVEHIAAARGRFVTAFFTANGIISLALGALGTMDILLR